VHAQELRDKDKAAGETEGEGHEPSCLVDKHLGLDEAEVATMVADLTASGARMFFTQWALDRYVSANT
jgi:hypothetical protein